MHRDKFFAKNLRNSNQSEGFGCLKPTGVLTRPHPSLSSFGHWSNAVSAPALSVQKQQVAVPRVLSGVVAARPVLPIAQPVLAPMPIRYPFLVNIAGVAKMAPFQTERPFPAHVYVDVATITRTASALIFVVCLFSIVIGVFTGFNVVQPFAAILIGFCSSVFFVMGVVLKREWSSRT